MKEILHMLAVLLGLTTLAVFAAGFVFFSASGLAWAMILAGIFIPVFIARLYAGTFPEGADEAWTLRRLDGSDKPKDVLVVREWERRRRERRALRGRFWDLRNLMNSQGIGKQWAGGYTVHLDALAHDVTAEVRHEKMPAHLYGRRSQVELLERMLVRAGGAANVVLIGPAGVGRHRILRAFAQRVNSGETFGPLRYMRLLELDTSAVVSGAQTPGDVVEKIQTLFGEAHRAGNVILVINNIDAFLDPEPEAGRVNATEALLPFLQSRLHIIGLTTMGGYERTIGKNAQLQRLTSKLELAEPSDSETLMILQDEAVHIERMSGLFFTHAALREIVELTSKLIQDLPQPEKALEVLEETAVYNATKLGQRKVLPEHVQAVITARTKIPVGKPPGEEKELLLNLESALHERIIGQEEAIKEIADALRRARSGVRSEKRPIGSFLFLGPTGVGKTETTKAIAAVYFGDEKRMIRFDMSEFQAVEAFQTRLSEAVVENPFGVILLDEIEKAAPKVWDLLLQVLDEGHLTDSEARKVSFVNTMIVATSNAVDLRATFRPEFLNRFDGIVTFKLLTQDELLRVVVLLLQDLNSRLKGKEIQINITPELAAAVVRGGFDEKFGARPLRRWIQDHIENYIAKGLLDGSIKAGDTVEIPSSFFPSS